MDDSRLIPNFLDAIDYEAFQAEIDWRPMTIGGRELCRRGCFQGHQGCPANSGAELPQGRPQDNAVPWLRCPSIEGQDILPLTPTVQALLDKINERFQVQTNIVKIQRYDDGKAFIRAHSDKVLDLAPDVPIFNYRIGATRTLVMTHKLTKERRLVPMPHNSLFVIGPQTNREWLHGIEVEDMDEPSISMIVRQSVTYKHADGTLTGPTAHLCREHKELVSGYGTENKTVYHSHEEALQAYA